MFGHTNMKIQEVIDLLMKARNLLHPVNGEVSNYSITLAHDYIDMVVDELVDTNFEQKQYFKTRDELSLQMYEDEERFYQELMDEPSASDIEYFEDCKYFNPWI